MTKVNMSLSEYKKLGKFMGNGYEIGDYIYKLNNDNETLYVEVKESAKKNISFKPFLAEVEGKKVIRADWCYANCVNMEYAPEVPYGVISMRASYLNCFRLKETPILPDSVEDMSSICQNNYSLKKINNFPENAVDMNYSFNGCCDLEDVPEKVPDSVSEMYATFSWCLSMQIAPELPFALEHLPATFSHTNIKAKPLIPLTVKDTDERVEHAFCKCDEQDKESFRKKKEAVGIFDNNIEKSIADDILEKDEVDIREETPNEKEYQTKNIKEELNEER